MNRHHYGLILAGGRGTRFWPRSRKRSAKQVLNVVGERSLIQATVDRLTPLISRERLWVLTNHHLRDIIIKQLPEIPRNQILAEPMQRNTAPAIGLAAQILHSLDPDAVMGVFPSDHVIGKIPQYRAVIKAAFKAAVARHLVVVGIQPRWPETGYGYIEFPRGCAAGGAEALAVRHFHEKPELPKAKRYLKAGNFFWNSGMFFWRTGVLLDQLRQHLPRTATVLASLPPSARERSPPASSRPFRSATTSPSTTRCWKKPPGCTASLPAISAGTTSEAGMPSTSFWNATRRGIPSLSNPSPSIPTTTSWTPAARSWP